MTTRIAATALMMTRGLGRKTLASLAQRIGHRGGTLPDLLTADTYSLTSVYGLSEQVAADFPRAKGEALRIVPQLDQRGVQVLTVLDGDYPQRLIEVLGDDAPTILFVAGNVELLSLRSVGFCGSRKASEKGHRVGRDSAAMLARQGLNVVSGYASGVDLEVHRSALEAGGTTAFVLADGILHFRAKREVAPLLTPSNHVVVSEFPPRLPWLARNAMQRNATIIGLSDAMIVIEAGTTGGTFACAECTLKYGHPLFVAHYAMPADSAVGNDDFLRRGATPLRGNAEGVPNLSRLLESIEKPRPKRLRTNRERLLFSSTAGGQVACDDQGMVPDESSCHALR